MKNKFTIGAIVASASILSCALLAQAQEITVTSAPVQVAQPMSAPAPQDQGGVPADMARGLGAPDQQGQKPPMMQAKTMGTNTGDKKPGFEPVLNIDPKGHILVRGELMSVTGTTLTVKAWGITFTVDASKVSNSSAPDMNITSFKVGDFVGVSGNISADAPQNIIAEVVRDRSIVPTKLAKDVKNTTSVNSVDNNAGSQGSKPPMVQGQQGVKPSGIMNTNGSSANTNIAPQQGTNPTSQPGKPVQQGQQRPMMGQGQGNGRPTGQVGVPPQAQSAPVAQ
jgi:hypothetical protein